MSTLDPFIRVVANMMTRFGGTSVLETAVTGVYDPETSSVVSTPKLYTVKTLGFDYIQKKDGIGTEWGGLIRNGDKQLYIQSSPTTPRPIPGKDKITFQGIKYSVVVVKELNPSGKESVFY